MIRKTIFTAATLYCSMLAGTTQAETVRIGLLLPYSGIGAEFGEQIERGFQLYFKLHPEALGGHTVEMVRRDTKRPGGDVARTSAQDLILNEKVQVLAGFETSPDAIAVAPIATSAKVPMIVLNAATAWLPNLSPYMVRLSRTMWQSSYPLGEYAAKSLECGTAVIGYTDYPPGKDGHDAFKLAYEQAGGKVLESLPMGSPAQVPDFTPFYQRVRAARPDCFYVFIPGGNHVPAALKTYADLNMRQEGIKLIGPGDLVQDTKMREVGDAALGVVSVMDYSPDHDTPENRSFLAAWREAYGEDSVPEFMAVYGYDGAAAIAHAIKSTDGAMDPDRVIESLKGWGYVSPRGEIRIDPETRDVVMDQKVQEVVTIDGRPGMKVLSTFPAVKDPCKELRIGKCAEGLAGTQ